MLICGLSLYLLPVGVHALPALQLGVLDTTGGTNGISYDTVTETTLTSEDLFTVLAFGDQGNPNFHLDDTHMLSVAITPKAGPDPVSYGSFRYKLPGDSDFRTPVNVGNTTDMNYGTPPVDTLYPDLGSHGIYDTFYIEIPFTFDSSMIVSEFDVENGMQPLMLDTSGMYYFPFEFDTSALAADVELHFDLYNTVAITRPSGSTDYATLFAPFSHDAGTLRTPGSPGTGQGNGIPVPGTLALFLLGGLMAGVGWRGAR